MAVALATMNITHPGTVLQGEGSELPRSRIWAFCGKGRKTGEEMKGAKVLADMKLPLKA